MVTLLPRACRASLSFRATLLQEDMRWQQHFSYGGCEEPARAALPMPLGLPRCWALLPAGAARTHSPRPPACDTGLASPELLGCPPQGLDAPLSFPLGARSVGERTPFLFTRLPPLNPALPHFCLPGQRRIGLRFRAVKPPVLPVRPIPHAFSTSLPTACRQLAPLQLACPA